MALSKDYEKLLQRAAKDWDVDAIVKAIIEDDPELAEDEDDLRKSLLEAKEGSVQIVNNKKATGYQSSSGVFLRNKFDLDFLVKI